MLKKAIARDKERQRNISSRQARQTWHNMPMNMSYDSRIEAEVNSSRFQNTSKHFRGRSHDNSQGVGFFRFEFIHFLAVSSEHDIALGHAQRARAQENDPVSVLVL